MSGSRFVPRNLPFEDLLKVLVEEHSTMKEGLRQVKEAAERRDFERVSEVLNRLDPIFRQHIADEEGQILRLLVKDLGVEGAKEEIRVFQQHRPIYSLMQAVSDLASKKVAELANEQAKRGMSKEEMPPSASSMFLDASVLINFKADEYVAVFGISEDGATVEECGKKVDGTIGHFTDELKQRGIVGAFAGATRAWKFNTYGLSWGQTRYVADAFTEVARKYGVL
jgi:hypothetical protein